MAFHGVKIAIGVQELALGSQQNVPMMKSIVLA
jgi:hypothetical protein